MEYRRFDPLSCRGWDDQCIVPRLSWITRRCFSGALAAAGRAIIHRAAADTEHRILWFDDRAGPVLVRTAIARFVVVGGAAGCDLHDPKRLYLLFHRPSAGYLPSRGRARAGSPAAADFLHHFWSFSLCARGGVAAAMVAEPMRRSNVLPFPRSVRPHAAED